MDLERKTGNRRCEFSFSINLGQVLCAPLIEKLYEYAEECVNREALELGFVESTWAEVCHYETTGAFK
ncbi:hypothetical protein Y032_0010g1120 [Ancylostoma ceylanicum]|uniref:Uncharacterized protein n=1 Tax=Ancylostoma ceylanicum TaxID=53326 RepID=A0A016VFF5_9BILA|nr:hypothetical protein Y032_0010g1120 [Ancylostoma ceylanicum]